jgi:hypothetical protein
MIPSVFKNAMGVIWVLFLRFLPIRALTEATRSSRPMRLSA